MLWLLLPLLLTIGASFEDSPPREEACVADADKSGSAAWSLIQTRSVAKKAEQERAATAVEEEAPTLVAAEKVEPERLVAAEKTPVAAEKSISRPWLAAVRGEKAEPERLAAEKAEKERLATEKAEQGRLAAEKTEQERAAAAKVEEERLAAAKAEAERLRLVAEKAEQERLAAEKTEQERAAAAKVEEERLAAEKAEAERLRLVAEKAEQERLAAEQGVLLAKKAEQDRRLATLKADVEQWAVKQVDESSCQLGPAAKYGVELTSDLGCEVVSNGLVDGQCMYKMKGNCTSFLVEGCEFWGTDQSSSRRLPLELPKALESVDGEVDLGPQESAALAEMVHSCAERPAYWTSSDDLRNEFARQVWVGSLGSESTFHFIQSEVGIGDFYELTQFGADAMQLIVDVGANIGWFSIAACRRFPKARILAFEPHPLNYRFLLQNLKSAGCENNVEAHNLGLSRDGRDVVLNWINSGGSSAYVGGDVEHQVTMKTILPADIWDRFLGAEAEVSFMKVDCEGCEYEFLPLVPPSKVVSIRCELHPGLATTANASNATADLVSRACEEGSLKAFSSSFLESNVSAKAPKHSTMKGKH